MKRREFMSLVCGAALIWPLNARAQPERIPRIGVLLAGTPSSFGPRTGALLQGLWDLGYVEGKTISIEWRCAHDRADRLLELSAELVKLNVDVIITGGTPAAKALKLPRDRYRLWWRSLAIR